MTAAFLELDHGLTTMAALPCFPFRRSGELGRFLGPGAFGRVMPLAAAGRADLGAAAAALGVPPPAFAADVLWPDPLTTSPRRTIQTAPAGVLQILLVPLPLEVGVKELLDVFERDMISGAASGGHVLRVGEGQFEDTAKARVAYAMAASELDRLIDRHLAVSTDDARGEANPKVRTMDATVGIRTGTDRLVDFPECEGWTEGAGGAEGAAGAGGAAASPKNVERFEEPRLWDDANWDPAPTCGLL